MQPQYLCIDLKSFYASVECIERGLDPMTTHLVVADLSRTEKTICLAVTPSLKAYGIPGRARLFEVVQRVKEINAARGHQAPGKTLTASSWDQERLQQDPTLALDYIIAPPRMAHYMEYSTRIYRVYLNYVAPEDIHVYSIDEVFIDLTPYLATYRTTAEEITKRILRDVFHATGITATAGIGTNLYLAKIAMDIVAKHMPADRNGVRIASLDELSYRQKLWEHRPLTDFWRVGKGYAKKLESNGLHTMGDIARCSLYHEAFLYRLFGINAELLIDHAWGWEPCTLQDIKTYRPSSTSLSRGQVLQSPYDTQKARLVVQEMAEQLALELVEQELITEQVVLDVGYDIQNLTDPAVSRNYDGEITTDFYGRKVPKRAHGTTHLGCSTSSSLLIVEAILQLYDRIVQQGLWVRRLTLTACKLSQENSLLHQESGQQLDFFTDAKATQRQQQLERALVREKAMQKAMLTIRNRYGKNAILKGMNLLEGATAKERNRQIGGHQA